MKRTVPIIATVAAVHFALMYLTTMKTVDHNLSKSLAFFGAKPLDTPFTKSVSGVSAVLRQPVDSFLDLLPATEPKEETVDEEIFAWLCYALNSLLWGGLAYLTSYGFRYRRHQHPRDDG